MSAQQESTTSGKRPELKFGYSKCEPGSTSNETGSTSKFALTANFGEFFSQVYENFEGYAEKYHLPREMVKWLEGKWSKLKYGKKLPDFQSVQERLVHPREVFGAVTKRQGQLRELFHDIHSTAKELHSVVQRMGLSNHMDRIGDRFLVDTITASLLTHCTEMLDPMVKKLKTWRDERYASLWSNSPDEKLLYSEDEKSSNSQDEKSSKFRDDIKEFYTHTEAASCSRIELAMSEAMIELLDTRIELHEFHHVDSLDAVQTSEAATAARMCPDRQRRYEQEATRVSQYDSAIQSERKATYFKEEVDAGCKEHGLARLEGLVESEEDLRTLKAFKAAVGRAQQSQTATTSSAVRAERKDRQVVVWDDETEDVYR